MTKIKFLARSIVFLAATQTIDVSGEYYIVQPGDVLTTIASKKISQSNLPVNLEQAMLTIYKLNPEVFRDGDVDRVLPGKRIYIPDNVADFVQLSKNEAIRRLRDRNYLRGLYASASKLKLTGLPNQKGGSASAMQDYGQILQTLENHQQNIDILKIENAHLSKSFKLLERALGRIVVVQGLLTNDVVKVKSKLFNTQSNVGFSAAPTSENMPTEKEATTLTDTASVSLPKIEDNLSKTDAGEGQMLEDAGQLPVTDPNSLSVVPLEPATVSKTQTMNSRDASQERSLNKNAQNTIKQEESSENNAGLWLDFAMIAAVILPLLLLLLWILDFKKIRTKLMPSKAPIDISTAPRFPIKDRLVPSSDANRYSVNIPSIDDLNHEVAPVKIKTERAENVAKDQMLVDRRAELSSAMELLDMCLLFGDYQQAHSITLKAISDHQTSPILSKKLAFIERKLAKY